MEADTSTSFVEAGTTTAVTGDNLSWKYGQRTYEFENKFVSNTATAQGIVDGLFTEFNAVKNETKIKCKFVPHIDVLDPVDLSYHSYDLADQPLWDQIDWATDPSGLPPGESEWAKEGENFDFDNKEFVILGKKTNLDNFTTQFTMREI